MKLRTANCALQTVVLFLLATSAHAECVVDWKRIATGIDYRTLTCVGEPADVDLHVVKMSRKFWTFDVSYVASGSSARREADARKGGFAMNANFFAVDRSALGLIVRSGEELQPAHKVSWQSIFLIDAGGEPQIIPSSVWPRYRAGAQMAVQAGPRLVVNGKTTRVSPGYPAARCGVCIQTSGELLFFASPPQRKFDVAEIARIAKRAEADGGLECRDAMLFDGGHSTQIFVRGDDQSVRIDGDLVPVFVVATRR